MDEVLQVFANWQKLAKLDRAAEGISQQVVTTVLSETADLRKLVKLDRAAAEHATDFDPPIYNIRIRPPAHGGQ